MKKIKLNWKVMPFAIIALIAVTGFSTLACGSDAGGGTAAVAVTGVSLNKNALALEVGASEKLTATVAPANAANRNVIWSSSDDAVATVSGGTVKAVSAGSAAITVITAEGGKSAACAVSVTAAAVTVDVTGVSLDKDALSLIAGASETLTATVAPADATNQNVTWSSLNSAIASVTQDGVVTAESAGETTITVTTEDGGKTADCAMSVTAATAAVSFISVTANGFSTQTTTQLILTFSAPVTGLEKSDIALGGVSGVSAGALFGGNPYTLTISGFTSNGTLSVSVSKTGYDISGSPKTVRIYYVEPDIPVTFESAESSSPNTETTKELTLTFDAPVTGLSETDITLSGIPGVIKGALTGSNPYALAISGFAASGALTVSAAKEGYAISGSPKVAYIYYFAPITDATPNSLASYLSSLPTNSASSPHTVRLIVRDSEEFPIIAEALQGAADKYVSLDLTGSAVASMGERAFSYCGTLAGITIPAGVTGIELSAFQDCVNLASVHIPDSVAFIAGYAFYRCASLASVTIPDSVSAIGGSAFYGCDRLTSVEFKGAILSGNFSSGTTGVSDIFYPTFPGDLRDRFYMTNAGEGTPGKYTRAVGGSIWTRQ